MRTIIIAPDIDTLILDSKHPFGVNSPCKLIGTASGGESGMRLLDDLNPEIVVLDMQIPDMDGLEMLYHIRKIHMTAKVIILTSDVSFPYMQKAIMFGIDACLQKPVSQDEFQTTMRQIQVKVKITRQLLQQYTLDDTLMAGMTGKLQVTEEMQEALRENYGFVMDRSICALMVFLGTHYMEFHTQVRQVLREAQENARSSYFNHIMEIKSRNMIIQITYAMDDEEKVRHYFEEAVVPKLAREICPSVICAWRKIENLSLLHKMLEELEGQLDWNLMFGSGILITYEKIERLRVVPFTYPKELANRAKRALINRQPMLFGECVKEFSSQCRVRLHRPKDVKEACLRFCIGIIKVARNCGYEPKMGDQDILQTITNALSWKEIDDGLEQMFRRLLLHRAPQNTSSSTLVQKAWKIIHEEYHTSLTLGGLARRLYVSEEYLSSQFKKETGKTFGETVKYLRIEKAQDMLIHTKLKVSQIAELIGYRDPKYMSRVFREVTGVGPAEYRKIH